MGNLRDELVRKGLMDDKRARQMAHEEKARRHRTGHEAVAQEKQQQDTERRAKVEARREEDRRRETGRLQQQHQQQETLRLAQLLRDNALREGVRGSRRFHFVTSERKIPFMDLSEEMVHRLETGQAAICAVPGPSGTDFLLVTAETARRALEIDKEAILFWAGSAPIGIYS